MIGSPTTVGCDNAGYGGAESTIVMVDHQAGPAHPPQWSVRSEAFAAARQAPLFSVAIPFDAGQKLRFTYAVVVADGTAGTDRASTLAELGRHVLEVDA